VQDKLELSLEELAVHCRTGNQEGIAELIKSECNIHLIGCFHLLRSCYVGDFRHSPLNIFVNCSLILIYMSLQSIRSVSSSSASRG
jgi:hypothetical protein